VLRKTLVVAQVVVDLRHDDKERGESQAQPHQIQQARRHKLAEHGRKVSDDSLHTVHDLFLLQKYGNKPNPPRLHAPAEADCLKNRQ